MRPETIRGLLCCFFTCYSDHCCLYHKSAKSGTEGQDIGSTLCLLVIDILATPENALHLVRRSLQVFLAWVDIAREGGGEGAPLIEREVCLGLEPVALQIVNDAADL